MKIINVFSNAIEITDTRTSKVISYFEKDFLLSFHHKLGPEIERSGNLDSRIRNSNYRKVMNMLANENKSIRGFGEELLNGPGSNNSGRGDEFDGQLNAADDVIDDVLGIAAMEFLDQTLKVLKGQVLHFYIRKKTLTSQKMIKILVHTYNDTLSCKIIPMPKSLSPHNCLQISKTEVAMGLQRYS